MRLAINKARKALGVSQVGKLIAYTALEQEHAWEQLGVTISQVIKEGGAGRAQDLDLLFTGQKTMAGVPIKASINANTTRVDFLDLSHWGRAVMQDIDFYEVGGQTVFPIYGSSGGISAAYIFYFIVGLQVWTDAPRAGAYICNLVLPSGYQRPVLAEYSKRSGNKTEGRWPRVPPTLCLQIEIFVCQMYHQISPMSITAL